MLLLTDRQTEMRRLVTELEDETITRKDILAAIKSLRKMEEQSADGSRATMARSEHDHVKKSGAAALQNRLQTIGHLDEAREALLGSTPDIDTAIVALTAAANSGGKKSAKAARKAPSIALYVQYLTETDENFQAWLSSQGVSV